MSYKGDDHLIGSFAIGITIGLMVAAAFFTAYVVSPIRAAEDERRIVACVEAGYDRVVDDGYIGQVRDQTSLGCTKRLVVNGTLTEVTHWIPYTSQGG